MIVAAKAYKMDPALRDKVLEAASSADLDVASRSRLYAALNRAMERPGVPPAAVAEWAEAGKNKFAFRKLWARDTSLGQFKVTEKKTTGKSTYTDQQMVWVCKVDLISKYAAAGEQGLQYVDKLLSSAKASRPHPMMPKDKECRLYKVFANIVEGVKTFSDESRGYAFEGDISDGIQAEAVAEARTFVNACGGLPRA